MGTLWADILGKLSQRKASINGAAQFALERPAEADVLLAAVVARLGACQREQRVPALFLVDCICQRGWKEAGGVETGEVGGTSSKDTIAFVHAVGSFLKQIVAGLLPAGDPAPEVCRRLRSVLGNWERKHIFDADQLEPAWAMLKAAEGAPAAGGAAARPTPVGADTATSNGAGRADGAEDAAQVVTRGRRRSKGATESAESAPASGEPTADAAEASDSADARASSAPSGNTKGSSERLPSLPPTPPSSRPTDGEARHASGPSDGAKRLIDGNSVSASASTAKFLRAIELHRSEAKRARFEAKMRPAGFGWMDEFRFEWDSMAAPADGEAPPPTPHTPSPSPSPCPRALAGAGVRPARPRGSVR